jgi:hypothetical protein
MEITDENFWELWMLDDASRSLPYWGVAPSDIDNSKAVVVRSKKSAGGKADGRNMISNGYESDDSYGSMPSLETASDSFEDDDDEYSEESEEESDDDEDSDADSHLQAEDELRKLYRDAMDIAHTNPDYLDPMKKGEGFLTEEERKSNPFLKLLGSLRGQ